MIDKSGRRSDTLWTAPFLISLAILGITAVGLGPATRYMRVILTKEPVPLRSALSRLDKTRLGPFRFTRAFTLESAVVNTLGTQEYINWILEDSELAGTNSPLRYVNLFVTYYTGQPDPVPHTPDVCMVGAGYVAQQIEDVSVHVEGCGPQTQIPVRTLTFLKSGIFDRDKMPVIYTFHTNGRFASTREAVRAAAGNPLDRHAYYSKVEVKFGWDNSRPRYPTGEEAIAGTQRLFRHVLPLLVNEHWPDWQALKKGGSADSPAKTIVADVKH